MVYSSTRRATRLQNKPGDLLIDDAVERLIAGLRLRSGALQDDGGIILLERLDGGEIG
jgi:hypothetical protein